ncbi:MAG: DUF1295 domain-containing protein [Spirochaetia bacterium]
MTHNFSNRHPFLIVIFSYIASFAAALIILQVFPANLLIRTLAADIAATVVIFICSFIFNNSSLYDPYWSVWPPFMYLYWMSASSVTLPKVLLLVGVLIWAIRLTANWAAGWQGMGHEDWRYQDFRKQFPKLYWGISFFGIHLFPTIIVFISSVPAYFLFSASGTSTPLTMNFFSILSLLIIILAVGISYTADKQLREFKQRHSRNAVIQSGLWKYSRHPNYLGEILFWWGIYFYTVSFYPELWYLILCPMVILLLFEFISIPMMENRLKAKNPDYFEVHRNTPRLLIWRDTELTDTAD